MNYVVNQILKFLNGEKVIKSDDDTQNFYRYGIEITISSFLNILLVSIIGILTQTFCYSVLYLFTFIFLRSFLGGYHATTYLSCNVTMCICYLSVITFQYLLGGYISFDISIIISVLFLLTILLFCPIENVNKPIDENRKILLKLVGFGLGLIFATVSSLLIKHSNKSGIIILFTLISIAVFIVVAIFLERRTKYEEEACETSTECN